MRWGTIRRNFTSLSISIQIEVEIDRESINKEITDYQDGKRT
jgi:hypothetical protein